MSEQKNLTLDELHSLIVQILQRHDTNPAIAAQVATALVAAEADGQKGHGASRVPSYAGQARTGKVKGHAAPQLHQLGESAAVVDACDGFAYPAIKMAQDWLVKSLTTSPVAAVSLRNFSSLGCHRASRRAVSKSWFYRYQYGEWAPRYSAMGRQSWVIRH